MLDGSRFRLQIFGYKFDSYTSLWIQQGIVRIGYQNISMKICLNVSLGLRLEANNV